MPSLIKQSIQLRYRMAGVHRDVGWNMGMNRHFFKRAKGARILAYHGICAKDPLRYNTLFISAKKFEAQLRFYKEYFNLVSLDEYYALDLSNDKFSLCLTFDDGFENNYKYVLPLLEKYQVPATFFVTGIRQTGSDILWNDQLSLAYAYGPAKFIVDGHTYEKGPDKRYISNSTGQLLAEILRKKSFPDKMKVLEAIGIFKHHAADEYWKVMDEEQLKTMASSKWVTIGSHSLVHNDLVHLDPDELKSDLKLSKEYLESRIGKTIKSLAFPYGSYSPLVVKVAKEAGYSQLLATEFLLDGDANDVTLRQRLTINPFISTINQIHAIVSGHY